jgi:hypothetical protein
MANRTFRPKARPQERAAGIGRPAGSLSQSLPPGLDDSPLEQILNANRDLIHGDVWLVCDGPVDQSGQQTVVFGARGDAHLAITVYGPHHGLHSGHYGNWAPNPAMMLAQLLAGIKMKTAVLWCHNSGLLASLPGERRSPAASALTTPGSER